MPYATYYRFMTNGMKTINGVALKSNLCVNRYLSFEGSLDFGSGNKYAKYIGLQITIPFGTPDKPLSYLERKLTALPIREIDVVSDIKKEVEKEFTVDGNTKILIEPDEGGAKGDHFITNGAQFTQATREGLTVKKISRKNTGVLLVDQGVLQVNNIDQITENYPKF